MSQDYDAMPQSSFSSVLPAAVLSPQPTRKSRRFRRLALQWLGGCVVFGVTAFCFANLVTSWLLNRELAAIVQRGEPLRFGELVPARVPDAQNAALVYLRAADALTLSKSETEELRDNKGEQVSDSGLVKNQTAIALVRQAAALPACRFPVDYDAENLAGILLPHLRKMRDLADVLRDLALWEARRGQTDMALNDVATLFRMSEHLAPEPILISGLTAMAIESAGYKTLAGVLQDASLSPAQAKDFALRLCHTDWTAAIHHDLQGERCFGLWAFQYVSNPIEAKQLTDGPAAPRPNFLTRGLGILWSPMWKMDEIHYLRAHDWQSQALLTPETPLMANDRLIEQIPRYAICTRIMLPDLSRVARKRDAILNYQRMALVALALNAYRTTHGQYPSSLHEAETFWGAPLPRDVYTQQSFLYKNESETMRLYSVGPNHQDDGGQSARTDTGSDLSTNHTQDTDDLAW